MHYVSSLRLSSGQVPPGGRIVKVGFDTLVGAAGQPRE